MPSAAPSMVATSPTSGTLRAYLDAYLRAHAGIRKDMTLMVRQLALTTDGLPLEIYCFTATTAWAEYEGIQADIFDHIFAIIEQFHLRLHQSPTGCDDMHSWKTADPAYDRCRGAARHRI